MLGAPGFRVEDFRVCTEDSCMRSDATSPLINSSCGDYFGRQCVFDSGRPLLDFQFNIADRNQWLSMNTSSPFEMIIQVLRWLMTPMAAITDAVSVLPVIYGYLAGSSNIKESIKNESYHIQYLWFVVVLHV